MSGAEIFEGFADERVDVGEVVLRVRHRLTDPARTPVLLVHGTEDTLYEPVWPDKLAEVIPGAEVARLPHGHSPNITHPRETWDILGEFLARATGAAN